MVYLRTYCYRFGPNDKLLAKELHNILDVNKKHILFLMGSSAKNPTMHIPRDEENSSFTKVIVELEWDGNLSSSIHAYLSGSDPEGLSSKYTKFLTK